MRYHHDWRGRHDPIDLAFMVGEGPPSMPLVRRAKGLDAAPVGMTG
jgi:hypothetical protein